MFNTLSCLYYTDGNDVLGLSPESARGLIVAALAVIDALR